MLIGYARVSTDDQDTAAQVRALKTAECERIYREKASGGRWNRLCPVSLIPNRKREVCCEVKGATFPDMAVHPKAAAHEAHEPRGNGQSQSCTGDSSGSRTVSSLYEGFKDAV